jgi:uncharacterized repeat protein (TIGR01451 family)/CSLREA domain-containing protein
MLESRQLLTNITFLVNSTDDLPDVNPGDGIAAAAGGVVTLRAAIMEANARAGEETIELPAGTYFLTIGGINEDGAATGDLDIVGGMGSVTIRGTGLNNVTIDASGKDRVFDVLAGAGLRLENLTVRHGFLDNANGVGIRSAGQLNLDTVRVANGTSGANPTNGGSIAVVGGFATIFSSELLDNTISGDGGALFVSGGSATVIRTSVAGNEAGTFGGGVRVQGSGFVNIVASTISGNTADNGGGISNVASNGGGLELDGVTVDSNTVDLAVSVGAGIHNTGTLKISRSLISNNTGANLGGGLYNTGTGSIRNSTFTDNVANFDGEGGGIYQTDAAANLFVESSTITLNNASIDGGGVQAARGSFFVRNTVVANNFGGPLGDADVSGTLSSAGHNLIGDRGTVTSFTNGTNGDIVGGEFVASVLHATNTTPIVITATRHGLSTGDKVRISGVNGNNAANGVFFITVLTTDTFELNGSTGNSTYTSGGSVNLLVNPRLEALADNGGPTLTHRPLPVSPLIDAGQANQTLTFGVAQAPETDQRGVPRVPFGGSTIQQDIGAFETGFMGFFVNTTDDTPDVNLTDNLALDKDGHTSLRAAIMQANSTKNGDIVVEPGTYTLTRTGTESTPGEFDDLDIIQFARVLGFGSSSTVVDANHISRAFDVASNSTITGLTIRNGEARMENGGGIRNQAKLTLVDVLVENSHGANGGGIYNSGSLMAERIFLFNNNATEAGGGLYNAGFSLGSEVSNSSISGNHSEEEGGGLANGGFSSIGGFSSNGQLALRQTIVSGNRSELDGGGIANSGNLVILGGSVNGNVAAQDAGGIGNEDQLTLRGVLIQSNIARRHAGGIGTTGGLTVLQSVIEDNLAGNYAGGIGISDFGGSTNSGGSAGDILIVASRIEDNIAALNAGGLALVGKKSVRVEFTEFTGNKADGGAGGGVFVSNGSLTLESSAVVNNVAGNNGVAFGDGGGVYVTGGSTSLLNVTVSGNTAVPFNRQGGAGGGVMHAGGKLNVSSATITDNTAAVGGGLATFANTQPLDQFLANRGTVQNTIIAENTATMSGADLFTPKNRPGAFVGSLGNNLIGIAGADSVGWNFVNGVRGDLVGTSGTPLAPKLDILAKNGGLTRTHALLAASPARDAGSGTASSGIDQRGVPRAIGTAQDIGAYEFGFDGIVVTTTADTVDATDGLTSLREAILLANATPGKQTIVLPSGRYRLTRTGAGEDAALFGDLDVTDSLQILGDGALTTEIDGIDQDRVFDILPGSKFFLSGVRIEHGHAPGFSSIANGGGIAIKDSGVTLEDVEVVNNTADGVGGGIAATQTSGSLDLTLIRTVIDNNYANTGIGGGGLAQFGGSLNVAGSTIKNNLNFGLKGGGAYLDRVNASITDTIFDNNQAQGSQGGALYLAGDNTDFTTTITRSLFKQNFAGGGGAIYAEELTLDISISTFFGNTANSGAGGAISSQASEVMISQSTFQSNIGFGGGGGVFSNSDGVLFVSGSEFSNNNTDNGHDGGGLLTLGSANVSRSTFQQNYAFRGGGISVGGGSLGLLSSTLSGNNAYVGGGLNVEGSASASLLNVTVTNNFAFVGGSGINNLGSSNLANTLVAGNALFTIAVTDADLSGSFTSNGNNLIGDRDSATGFTPGVNGDIVGGVVSTNIDTVSQKPSSPPRVTTTTAHGLATGDRVRIRGVTGGDQPAGYFTITVINATTFDLNDTGFKSTASGTGGTVTKIVNPLLDKLKINKTAPNMNSGLPPSTLGQPTTPVVTKTHALLPGSPAIDRGSNSIAPAFDQNNFPISSDGDRDGTTTADIGAFEVYLTTVTGTFFQDDNGNGVLDGVEFKIPGRTVYADLKRNGQYDDGEPFAITQFDDISTPLIDETGTYVLEFVPPGSQVIEVVLDNHERRTTSLMPLLGPPRLPDFTGVPPKAVALADLDFDGDFDIAAVDLNGNQLHIFLYDHGTLTPGGTLSMNGPRDVKIADVDNDGIQDIIVVNSANDTVTIVRRTLFGFETPIDVPVGDEPRSVAIGKLNNDEFVDLVVTNNANGSVQILFGVGNGTFTNGPTLTINGSAPEEVVIADFNLDFQMDIAVAFKGSNAIGVAFNNGGGNFSAISSFSTGAGSQPHSLVVEDFNYDGRPDLAFGAVGTNTVKLLLSQPLAIFSGPITVGTADSPTSLAAADIDLDGDVDLIVGSATEAGPVTTFQNFGDATFAAPVVTMHFKVINDVAVADFTGDGRPDVVVASNLGTDSPEILPQLTGAFLVTAETGVTTMNVNFGVQPLGSITGTVFNDDNGNKILDVGEGGIGSRTVFVDLDGDRTFDAYEPFAVSAVDGTYEITGVPAGFRSVIQIPVLGQGRQPSTRFVTAIGDGVVAGVDFANQDGFSVAGLNFASTAELLAQSLVGSGVTISNVTLTGSPLGIGAFAGGRGAGLGIEKGIVLSSGDVDTLYGPNDSPSTTTALGVPGDASLNALIPGSKTQDATVLELDFITNSDTLSFLYVFGSEEYNDSVGEKFNDVFGFFVDGINIAVINRNTPVAINNINLDMNADLFRNNEPSLGTSPFDTELDGFTAVLRAVATITPNVTHHLKLAIADARDPNFDSAVFLAAGSFVTSRTDVSVTVKTTATVLPNGTTTIFPDGTATLTYTITNNGTMDATGVMLTDVIPDGLTVTNVKVSQGTFETVGGVLTAALDTLAPSASATVTVTLDPDTLDLFSIMATVTANEFDPNLANNRLTTLLDVALDTPDTLIDVDAQANSIPEGAPEGSRVGVAVFAFDHQDDDVFYVQTDSSGNPIVGDAFQIDSQTGIVTVRKSSLLQTSSPSTPFTIHAQAVDARGNATPVAPFVINVTDVPDNSPPIVSILPARINVVEGTGGFNFVEFFVTLNKPATAPVLVNFTTRRGNDSGFALPEGIAVDAPFATDQRIGRDFYFTTGSALIPVGATTPAEPIRVQIETDNVGEPDEFFFVQLQSAENATLIPLQSVAIAQILDDDAKPQLIVSDAELLEGDGNTNKLRFRVELVGNLVIVGGMPATTTVDFATGNADFDSAIADTDPVAVMTPSLADYAATTGTLTFTSSTRVQFVEVNILGDTMNEADETVSLRFSNPTNLGLPRPDAVGAILNDDSNNVKLQITPSETSVREDLYDSFGNLVEQRIPLTVTLIGKPLSGNVTVTYTIQDGTATLADADYTIPGRPTIGTIEFTQAEIAAGLVTETIDVIIVADTVIEPTEMFSVLLSQPSNATIDPDFATTTIVIRNDDQAILTEDGDDLSSRLNDIFNDPDGNDGEKDPAVVAMLVDQARQFVEAKGLTDYILIVIDPVDFVLTDTQFNKSGFTENTGVVNQIPGTYYSGNGAVEVLVVPLPTAGTYNVQLTGVGDGSGGSSAFNGSATVVRSGMAASTTPLSGSLAEGSTLNVALQVANATNGPITVGLGLAAANSGNGAAVGVVGAFGQREFNNAVAQLFQILPMEFLDELHTARTLTDEEIEERIAKLFEKLDTNNDKMITADEVGKEVWKSLRASDKDADGKITLEELRKQIRTNAATKAKTSAPGKNGQPSPNPNQPKKSSGNNEGTKAKPTTFERNPATPESPNKKSDAGKDPGKTTLNSRPGNEDAKQVSASRPWWSLFLPWSEKNSTTKSQDTRNA